MAKICKKILGNLLRRVKANASHSVRIEWFLCLRSLRNIFVQTKTCSLLFKLIVNDISPKCIRNILPRLLSVPNI